MKQEETQTIKPSSLRSVLWSMSRIVLLLFLSNQLILSEYAEIEAEKNAFWCMMEGTLMTLLRSEELFVAITFRGAMLDMLVFSVVLVLTVLQVRTVI